MSAPTPHPYSAASPPERRSRARGSSPKRDPSQVRDDDLEPHEGLRYLSRLFKALAILLIVMLVAEVVIGLAQDGLSAISVLLIEVTRIVVAAGLLWGVGDIAVLLIESNHDLRANRILLGRVNYKLQQMLKLEADELELLAGDPSRRRTVSGPPPPAPPVTNHSKDPGAP